MSFRTTLNLDDNEKMLRSLGYVDTNNIVRNFNSFYNGKYTDARNYSSITYNCRATGAGTFHIHGSYDSFSDQITKTFPVSAGQTISGTISTFAKFHRVEFIYSSGIVSIVTILNYMKPGDPCCDVRINLNNQTTTTAPLNTTFSYVLVEGYDPGTLSISSDPSNVFNLVNGNELQLDNTPALGDHILTFKFINSISGISFFADKVITIV